MRAAVTMSAPVPVLNLGDRRSYRMGPARTRLAVAVICALFALLTIGAATRRELWVDEMFSIAIATGHSLEQPASLSDPQQGDFVQASKAMPVSAYRQYGEQDSKPAGIRRVLRAVRLSDTSPPLYYIAVNLWTRIFGTGEVALRLFSILCGVACIPVIAALARRLGGRGAVIPACAMFAFAPQSVYYGSEGRMYTMFLLLVLWMAWLTLRLHRRGATPITALLWIGVSAAGLVTHYFFLFPWSAATFWLLLYPHRLDRRALVGMAAAVGVIVAPWFVHLPQDMAAWRVTKGWLDLRPGDFDALTAQPNLLWSYFDAAGGWVYARAHERSLLLATLVLAAGWGFWRSRPRIASQRSQLLWLWLAAANIGLLAVDLLQHTYTRNVSRYALAGMPAAFLLVAVGFAGLRPRWRSLATAAVVLQWLPTYAAVFTRDVRSGPPFRLAAEAISARSDSADLVIVHSIPSGVLAVARYMNGPAPMADWVGQLGTRRVPEDVIALTAGKKRVFVVSLHDVYAPRVEEAYLHAHATEVEDPVLRRLSVREFVLSGTDSIHPVAVNSARPPAAASR